MTEKKAKAETMTGQDGASRIEPISIRSKKAAGSIFMRTVFALFQGESRPCALIATLDYFCETSASIREWARNHCDPATVEAAESILTRFLDSSREPFVNPDGSVVQAGDYFERCPGSSRWGNRTHPENEREADDPSWIAALDRLSPPTTGERGAPCPN
jgi:hypothetical protein